jgi:putative methionine-R-sulfoxide reductase with GAF domain
MSGEEPQDKNPAIKEIERKHRLLHAVITFVIVVLFAVIIRYAFDPVKEYLDFLPPISYSLIISIVLLLSVMGLYLSRKLTKQIVRIIEDYSNRLNKILNITSDLREELYGDILLEKIMDYALAITQSNAGALLMMNEDTDLTFKIVRGRYNVAVIGTAIEKGKGIAGWVAKNGQPLRLADAKADSRFAPDIDGISTHSNASVLCVPLKTTDGVIGVLELLREKYKFRERDEEIIIYLAEQAALSIIRAQFYEDQKNFEIHLTDMLIDAIDFHIDEKVGHARRVAIYSNMIAKELNLTEDQKKNIYFASLLHDVGFLKIRADDSYKKGVILKHPVIGYEMIKPINLYAPMARMILHHHERYDGFGYPSQLKGEDIPLGARIIAVSEAFDVMVSTGSYRVPLSFEESAEELKRNAGTQFDARLVALFLKHITPEQVQ